MKVLFTSVGRRVELIQAFRTAANALDISLTIYGADMCETAPALFFCDKKIQICRIDDRDYIPALVDYCREEKIDALIPTIDTDLLLLAQNKDRFESVDTKVIVSAEDTIKICRDKKATAQFFASIGLMRPSPFDDYKKYNLGFPAFIKPKNGSSSVNAHKVNKTLELELYAKEVPDYIVTPFVEGIEYTVDAFCDFNGKPLFITPRIRLSVRSGEVLKTQIQQDERIIEESKKIIQALKPCGAITIQLIRQITTNEDYFIEINPRFGGGAPLSIKAGADSAMATLKLINGIEMDYMEKAAQDQAIFSRFDQSVRVK